MKVQKNFIKLMILKKNGLVFVKKLFNFIIMFIKKINNKLQLKNNGELELVFIGTGNIFGYNFNNNNIILIKGNTHIVVDFGISAPYGLKLNTNLDMYELEVLLPTHSHSDHIGGIEALVLSNRYIGIPKYNKPKIKLIITEEYKEVLWNYSLKGGLSFNEIKENGKFLEIEDYFEIINPKEILGSKRKKYLINYEGIKIELFRTKHIPNTVVNLNESFITYGLFIEDKILFTGDTKFDSELIEEYGDRAEYIFHDCSLENNPVHCTLKELKTLDPKYKNKIILMHHSEDYSNLDISDFYDIAKVGCRYIF